jgi:hypothetical protein
MSSSTLSTINPTEEMCSFALFPVSYSDVTENKYIYISSVLIPICTVATAVSAMCQHGGTVIVCDSNPHLLFICKLQEVPLINAFLLP